METRRRSRRFDRRKTVRRNQAAAALVRSNRLKGKKAENALEKVGITVNKNMVPFDQKSPFITSGIRIGTPAVTTRGMKEDEMKTIVALIDKVISSPDSEDLLSTVMSEVLNLCGDFPLYRDLVS